ncbi:MAG: PIN domain-containing protein [Chromatiales bacterium]
MRVFLDANILFSAAKSDGTVRELLTLLVKAGHECWADGYVAEEARRNLAAKAPDGLPVLEELLGRVHVAVAQPHPATLQAALGIPEKDRPVLTAAIQLKCDVLVTGDRTHFGTFYGKSLGGVTVHSPRSLAETLFV